MRVFISHASSDKFLVERLSALLRDTFESGVVPIHSALPVSEGGIEPGREWLEWIQSRVADCQMIIILLTPESASRPWLMWEAGAVSGAGLASGTRPHAVPLTYWLGSDEVPPPLRPRQRASGTSRKGIADLLETISNHASGRSEPITQRREESRSRAIEEYLKAVHDTTRYYDVFLSCPITSLGGDETIYQEIRKHLADLRDAMVADGLKVYCAAIDEVKKLAEAYPGDVAAEHDLEKLRASKNFVLVYPHDTLTSCFVEAGYALALNIPSFYFLRQGTKPPTMLEGAPEVFKGVRKSRFRQLEEIVRTYKSNPGRICSRKEN